MNGIVADIVHSAEDAAAVQAIAAAAAVNLVPRDQTTLAMDCPHTCVESIGVSISNHRRLRYTYATRPVCGETALDDILALDDAELVERALKCHACCLQLMLQEATGNNLGQLLAKHASRGRTLYLCLVGLHPDGTKWPLWTPPQGFIPPATGRPRGGRSAAVKRTVKT